MTIETQFKIIYEVRPFHKALIFPTRIAGTLVICKKAYFLRRISYIGQKTELLGHKFLNPDITIEVNIPTELC
jgi:hypothetical protein